MANPLRVTKTYRYIERKEIRYRDTSYLPFRYREIHKGIQRIDMKKIEINKTLNEKNYIIKDK